MAYML